MEEIEATISGRVQLVMYRDFAQRKARALGIVGFVRNNEDGTVTAVAQASRAQLEKYIALLNKGSILSHVAAVAVEWRAPTGTYNDFTISY